MQQLGTKYLAQILNVVMLHIKLMRKKYNIEANILALSEILKFTDYFILSLN